MISLRFHFYPSTFIASFTHPTESLFVPAAVISLGTILLNITEYGAVQGHERIWLQNVMVVMFWIYCALAMLFTCGIYLIMYFLLPPFPSPTPFIDSAPLLTM